MIKYVGGIVVGEELVFVDLIIFDVVFDVDLVWVIDFIDGIKNFVYGFVDYGVMFV